MPLLIYKEPADHVPSFFTEGRFMSTNDTELARYINLKLAALGQPLCHRTADLQFLETAGPLLRSLHQKEQLLGSRLSPVDARIQAFLDAYLTDVCPGGAARIPAIAFNQIGRA